MTSSLVWCLLFLFAWLTTIIGLDSIFGAFVFGLSLPRDTFVKDNARKTHSFVVNVLLPLVRDMLLHIEALHVLEMTHYDLPHPLLSAVLHRVGFIHKYILFAWLG